MKTAAFIPFWSEAKDSYKPNPPNADISLLEGKTLTQIVAVLQDPVPNGADAPRGDAGKAAHLAETI